MLSRSHHGIGASSRESSDNQVMDSQITRGEGDLHVTVVNAFRAHWNAHNNQKPQKLIMNPAQERKFSAYQHPEYNPAGTYWGTPIESDPQTQGVMIALDGTVMPFADYDEKPT